jgi:5-formyltetrahydrofolate cyclo-ligase
LSLKLKKQQLREAVWRRLEEAGVARFPLPLQGRIPNFEGAEEAAERLRELKIWRGASIIFSNPDQAQKPVRRRVLVDGKTLIMATPRLKEGFLKVDPETVRGREGYASTIKGAFKFGKAVSLRSLSEIDLVITGCVAVDLRGFRLGKGGGYGDKEISLLRRLSPRAPIATTVHELQLVEQVPVEVWDRQVDIIATPKRVIILHGV